MRRSQSTSEQQQDAVQAIATRVEESEEIVKHHLTKAAKNAKKAPAKKAAKKSPAKNALVQKVAPRRPPIEKKPRDANTQPKGNPAKRHRGEDTEAYAPFLKEHGTYVKAGAKGRVFLKYYVKWYTFEIMSFSLDKEHLILHAKASDGDQFKIAFGTHKPHEDMHPYYVLNDKNNVDHRLCWEDEAVNVYDGPGCSDQAAWEKFMMKGVYKNYTV
jgi:hypothetical protein